MTEKQGVLGNGLSLVLFLCAKPSDAELSGGMRVEALGPTGGESWQLAQSPWTVDRPVDRPVDRSVDRCSFIGFPPCTVNFIQRN